MIRVTVWHEYRQDREPGEARDTYPNGIHGQIAAFLGTQEDITVCTATLDQPEHGLTKEVLDNTDVLIWWGHMAHGEVADEIVDRVQNYVLRGMGLIVLHSAHESKIFKRLMGTSCSLGWNEPSRERVWCCNPGHPIAQGIPPYFTLEPEEMYCEFFDIPEPDATVFLGWYSTGEVFRSGVTFARGLGRIFYFQPGHETFRSFYNEHVQRIIINAVRWAMPTARREAISCPHTQPLEPESKN